MNQTAAYQRFDQGEKVFAEALDEDAGKHVGIARKKYLHAAETYINVVKDVESPLLEHLKGTKAPAAFSFTSSRADYPICGVRFTTEGKGTGGNGERACNGEIVAGVNTHRCRSWIELRN